MIGVPDAYELPAAPGNGYLRTDMSTLIRFKAAYVSGPHRRQRPRVTPGRRAAAGGAVPAGPRGAAAGPCAEIAEPVDGGVRGTGAPAAVGDRWRGCATRARRRTRCGCRRWRRRRRWTSCCRRWPRTPSSACTPAGWPGAAGCACRSAIVDRPFEQRRDLLIVDLSGAGGHVGVAGGPQSGKSTLLRTLIAALALTHTPREVQFYCLDFGGGTLAIAGRAAARRQRRRPAGPRPGDPHRRRDHRPAHRPGAALRRSTSVDSMATYRAVRADGRGRRRPVRRRVPGRRRLVHAAAGLRGDRGPASARSPPAGSNYGVHLVVTASRWSEMHRGDARPARHPARAAAGRPGRLRDRPAESPRPCRQCPAAA